MLKDIVSFTLQKTAGKTTTSITRIRDDVPYPVVPPKLIELGFKEEDLGIPYSIKYSGIYITNTFLKLTNEDLIEKVKQQIDEIFTSIEMKKLRLKSDYKFKYIKSRYIGSLSQEMLEVINDNTSDMNSNIYYDVYDTFTIYKGNKRFDYTLKRGGYEEKAIKVVKLTTCETVICNKYIYVASTYDERKTRNANTYCKNIGKTFGVFNILNSENTTGAVYIVYTVGANCKPMRIEKIIGFYEIHKEGL